MSNYTEWSDEMQERVARRALQLGLSAMLPAEIVAKGDRPGHPFRGNQHTGGIVGRGSAMSASRIRREAMGGGTAPSKGEAMRSRGGASSRALRASRTGQPFKGVAGAANYGPGSQSTTVKRGKRSYTASYAGTVGLSEHDSHYHSVKVTGRQLPIGEVRVQVPSGGGQPKYYADYGRTKTKRGTPLGVHGTMEQALNAIGDKHAAVRAERASMQGRTFSGVAGSKPLTSTGGLFPNLKNKPWTEEEKAAARRGHDALEQTLRRTRPELSWWLDDYMGPSPDMVLAEGEDHVLDWRDVQGSKPKAGPVQHPYDPEAAAHPKGYRPLSSIAAEIRRDWGSKVNFGAKPYLDAMDAMGDISQNYGGDTGTSIAAYFLSNASSWKGDTARRVKAELKAMTKGTKIKRPSGYTPTTSGGTVIAQSRRVTAPRPSMDPNRWDGDIL